MRRLVKLIATFFYAGEVPFAPGTVGSFVGLLLYIALSANPLVNAVVFLVLTILGFFAAGEAEKAFGRKDPCEVVIDEVCGIFIVFLFVPMNLINIISGFLLYRLLDIVKPAPARLLEKLKGGYGIMLDDLLCGIYTNLILRILLKVNVLS